MRLAAFKRVEMLSKMHGHLTHRELSAGFIFQDERIPLVNPQRGIFKPRQMRYLLSIKTVIPKPGGRVWYDDQLEAHDQIYDGDDGIDYAFMGSDPNAADNQWLRAAYENQVGVIYFLGTAPGRCFFLSSDGPIPGGRSCAPNCDGLTGCISQRFDPSLFCPTNVRSCTIRRT